jgi:two-component system OmpR family sensor kinase
MVFDRFWRTEGGRSRGRGGAGLGLAIVKAIVNAHHGDVSARNAPDGGAMFTVILPIMQDGRQDTSNVTQTDRFAPSRPG